MELLKTTLENEMLFAHLDSQELQTLLGAMYGRDYKGGSDIITQGDEDGEEFFVMANGHVDIIIDEKTVASLTKGSFGELALIYGTARAATIRATTDMKCKFRPFFSHFFLLFSSLFDATNTIGLKGLVCF